MAEGVDWLLARTEGGAALLPGAALACRPGPGLDVSVPEYEVEVAGAEASVRLDAAAWAALAEDAELLRCALILGAAEHCLDLAVEHVTNRRQFGRPLASFQAMRHLLARQKLRSEEHTSELQSRQYLVCRLLLEKKKHNTSRQSTLFHC